jgi:hypothetical protein
VIMSVMDSSTYSGALIGESLRPGTTLEDIPLTVTKISRAALGVAEAGQPELWTVMEFEVAADLAAGLAEVLAGALLREGGWYCDFGSAEQVFVVFGGRVFRYPRGDRDARATAVAYGRSAGVPEAQLDWRD